MPDIFGRNPDDYAVVRARRAANEWDAYQRALATTMPQATNHHDFRALGSWGDNGQNAPEPFRRAEQSAQAIGFVLNNLMAIQTMVDEVMYLSYRLPEFCPLNMAIPDGADSYLVPVIDRAGRGRFITREGRDAPVAAISQRQVNHELGYAGIDALFTLEDIRRAAFAGVPLQTRTLEAAVQGALEHMEHTVLLGSDQYPGSTGLLNYVGSGDAVVNNRESTIRFSGATAATSIRDAINDDISWVISSTREIFSRNIRDGMTVYLPTSQFDLLSTRFVGDNEERSIMRSIRENNAWSERTGNEVRFISVVELDEIISTNGVGERDRMVVAVNDDRVFEAGISIPPRVLKIMDKGREICAQVEYKFSLIFMKRPTTIRYANKI